MTATTSTPTVSVNMCIYNGQEFIGEAIDSILAQTFTDWEMILVDDGSTDGTAAMLASYSNPKLRVFHRPHQGISKSRNYAISQARGEFIAVLDADDVAHPNRLSCQVNYLRKHPLVVALGCAYEQIDLMRNRTLNIAPPCTNDAIRKAMISGNPICHSSVMIRRSVLNQAGIYNESLRYAEDYELWSRLAQVGELANLPVTLVARRFHDRSVSNDMSKELQHLLVFWQVSNLTITRFGLPWPYRLIPLRSMCLLLVSDLHSAGKFWLRQRLALRRGKVRDE
ncbi:MAG: glycosyltransferase family 2 protein [Anaerolineae bacterium]